jgi:hypothetical protein
MVRQNRMEPGVEQRCLVNSWFSLHDLVQALPAETDIHGMPQRVHQVADFQGAAEDLAAVAANRAVAPNAGWVRRHAVATLNPEALMVEARRMNPDFRDRHPEVAEEGMPEIDGRLIIVPPEGEIADHLEIAQMGAVADEFDVVGSDAGLQRTVSATTQLAEPLFERLHPAANEEGGIVVLGDDAAVHHEGDADLLEPSLYDF